MYSRRNKRFSFLVSCFMRHSEQNSLQDQFKADTADFNSLNEINRGYPVKAMIMPSCLQHVPSRISEQSQPDNEVVCSRIRPPIARMNQFHDSLIDHDSMIPSAPCGAVTGHPSNRMLLSPASYFAIAATQLPARPPPLLEGPWTLKGRECLG
jgi:hypothetical protein